MSEIFGKTYNDVGNTNTDLLLKTRGCVKILFGNKFLDLIKDGKINSETSIIFNTGEVGDSEGFYIVDDSVVLVSNGNSIYLNKEFPEGAIFLCEPNKYNPDLFEPVALELWIPKNEERTDKEDDYKYVYVKRK